MEEVDFKDLTVSFKLDPDFNRTDAANAHLFKVAQQLGMKVKNAILDDSAAQIGTYNRRNQFYLEGSGEKAKKMLDYLKTQSMEQQRLMSSPQATEQERQAAAELLNFEVEVSRGGELLGRAGNHGYTSIPDGQSPQQFVESLVFGPAREKGLQSALERIEQNFRQTCAEPNADDLAILQVFKDSAAKKFAADFKAEHSLKGYAAARPQQRITHEYVLGAAEHNYYLRLDSAQAQRFPQEAKLLEKLLQNVGAQRDYFDFNGKSLDPNGQIFALTTAQTEKFKDLLAKSALSAQRLNQLTALYAGQELNYSPACRLDAGKFLRTGKCTVSCLERADFDLTAELGLKQEPKLQDVAVCVTKVENQELSEQLGIDQQKPQPVVLTGQQAAEFAQKAYSAGQQLVKKQAQTETRIEQKTDELAKARAQIEKLNNELMKLKEQNSTLAGLNAQAAELLTAQKKDALKQYESFGQEIKELKEQLQHLDQKLEFSVQLPAVRKSTPLVAVSLGAAAKGCKHAGQFFGHLMHNLP